VANGSGRNIASALVTHCNFGTDQLSGSAQMSKLSVAPQWRAIRTERMVTERQFHSVSSTWPYRLLSSEVKPLGAVFFPEE
jgi:hypothetical protein